MNNNDTIRKTLIVAVSLCLVCSALISFSAVELRDLQEANKTLDKQSKILSAAGLLEEDKDISVIFNSIQPRIVNLKTGLFDPSINLEDYDESSFSRNPETSTELNSENDLALSESIKSNYEKPSERKKRERSENIKRSKKIARMRKNF